MENVSSGAPVHYTSIEAVGSAGQSFQMQANGPLLPPQSKNEASTP
jgi:hypothetical protein